jgi:endoglucanase
MKFAQGSATKKVGTVLACAGALAMVSAAVAPGASAAISGSLFKETNTKVATWLNANKSDSRATTITNLIASQPAAHWVSDYNPSTVQSQVSTYIAAASTAGKVPQLVVYEIPNRDCGGASAGGAPDLNSYKTWVANFSKGLGTKTVIIALEPDSLALQTCLSSSDITARDNAISAAVSTIKTANPAAKVYLDAGHSAWNAPSETANRLKLAGVTKADGFFSNVSNYQLTTNEVAYGKNVLAALGNPSNLHQIIDTSRNGNGPKGSEWCDPTGRKIGNAPTFSTGQSSVDAFLWIKPPGEADGCAAAAGVFSPDLAYKLALGQ